MSRRSILIILLSISRVPVSAETVVDRFSEDVGPDALPAGWRPMTLKRLRDDTFYTLDREGEDYSVKAVSSGTSSGIFKEVLVDLTKTPVLSWRWKVGKALAVADLKRRKGDDCAARVYVGFRYVPESAGFFDRVRHKAALSRYGASAPGAILTYAWDGRYPVGSVFDNPYSGKAKVIVVESGSEKAGRWISESRNVLEDYRRAYGEDPPEAVSISLMTDSDNTSDSAVAWYDDIVFSAEP